MATVASNYGYFFESSSSDRPYVAGDYNRSNKEIMGNGVCCRGGALSTRLQCSALSGTMNTAVAAGTYRIEGLTGVFDSGATETHDAADATNPRIDSIIVEKDSSVGVRQISIKILKGTAAASPVAPSLTQNTNIWQERLCNVTIPATETDADNFTYTDQRTISYTNANVSAATETVEGVVELSTSAEATAGTNDTTAMTPLKTKEAIETFGAFTNDYCFLSRITSDQTSGANVAWNNEIADPSNMHDNSTNPDRITVVNAGTYVVSVMLLMGNSTFSGTAQLSINVNGTPQAYSWFVTTSAAYAIQAHITLQLSASDYVTVTPTALSATHYVDAFSTAPWNVISVQRVS